MVIAAVEKILQDLGNGLKVKVLRASMIYVSGVRRREQKRPEEHSA